MFSTMPAPCSSWARWDCSPPRRSTPRRLGAGRHCDRSTRRVSSGSAASSGARPETRMPGGLCVAVAVSMAPLAIYGVQDALGLWAANKPREAIASSIPLINGSWVYMELGAIVAAALALWRFPFPFILIVASRALVPVNGSRGALWRTGTCRTGISNWELRRTVSEIVGLVMIAAAWTIDLKWARARRLRLLAAPVRRDGAVGRDHLRRGRRIRPGRSIARSTSRSSHFGAVSRPPRLRGIRRDRRRHLSRPSRASTSSTTSLAFSFVLSAIGLAVVFAGVSLERRRRALNAYRRHPCCPTSSARCARSARGTRER